MQTSLTQLNIEIGKKPLLFRAFIDFEQSLSNTTHKQKRKLPAEAPISEVRAIKMQITPITFIWKSPRTDGETRV